MTFERHLRISSTALILIGFSSILITGAYLTDDSSGLFTNIFLTEPRTYGVSVTKSW